VLATRLTTYRTHTPLDINPFTRNSRASTGRQKNVSSPWTALAVRSFYAEAVAEVSSSLLALWSTWKTCWSCKRVRAEMISSFMLPRLFLGNSSRILSIAGWPSELPSPHADQTSMERKGLPSMRRRWFIFEISFSITPC